MEENLKPSARRIGPEGFARRHDVVCMIWPDVGPRVGSFACIEVRTTDGQVW